MASSKTPAYTGPMPEHSLSSPTPTSREISMAGWSISSNTTHIMNAAQIDEAAERLPFPLPEMTFADNHLTLSHAASGLSFSFGAMDSLEKVKAGQGWEDEGGGVKVKYAEEWGKTRTTTPSILTPQAPLPTTPIKPFDWTYSTLHTGVVRSSSSASTPKPDTISWRPTSESESIPLELLSRPDPILFYDEIPLFESELDDNGSSVLSVRIRVMPHSFFILHRHFLRVDGVLFRIRDIRVFHLFGSSTVIREVSGWEADYDGVKARLPPPYTDLSLLSNSGWVHQTLSAAGRRAPPSVKLEDGSKPWPGLGRKVEVLELSSSASGGDI